MEIKFIREEEYQRIKIEMNKNDDYFTMKELKTLIKRFKKLT